MNKKLLCLSILSSIPVFAQTSTSTIPFVYDKISVVEVSNDDVDKLNFPGSIMIFKGGTAKSSKVIRQSTEETKVETSKISELVTEVRNSICPGIKNGSFKVWLKFDANAKILGIGSSAEGGIEVNVNCGK